MLGANAQRILSLCNAEHVPVRIGASNPLEGHVDCSSGKIVHGEDGVGSKSDMLPPLPNGWTPHQQSASDFIVEQCKASPGEITIVTLGPLTNVALAMQQCSEIATLAKKIGTETFLA